MRYTLITGGTGYIGSHIAVLLHKLQRPFVLADNFVNSNSLALSNISKITGRVPEFVEMDITNTEGLSSIFRRYEIDSVIHMAGLKAVGESHEDPVRYYNNNVNGAISLLAVMREHRVKNLVFSSSATVYGTPNSIPLSENHTTGAISPYARTKLHIEEILKDLADSDPAWKIVILRYFNPAGAHASYLIGEDPSGIPNNLIPFITRVATGELKTLRIFGNDYDTPDGTAIRDYIHVDDLAKGHADALRWLEKSGSQCETFNLGTGSGFSVMEVLRAFEKASGKKIPFVVGSRREGDVPISVADVSKAKNILGWNSSQSLTSICESAWSHAKNSIESSGVQL